MADELNLRSYIRKWFWFWWYGVCPKHAKKLENCYRGNFCPACNIESARRKDDVMRRRLREWMN